MRIIVINVLVFLFEFSLDDYSRNAFIDTFGLVPDHFALRRTCSPPCFSTAAGCTCWATCGSCGSSATTSKTSWATASTCCFTWRAASAAAHGAGVLNPISRVPMVGASGAIAGVMGAYMVKFPHSRIYR